MAIDDGLRPALAEFAVKNRLVLEGLRRLLELAREPRDDFDSIVPPMHVGLRGGEDQVLALRALASDNGLLIREAQREGHPAFVLEAPARHHIQMVVHTD